MSHDALSHVANSLQLELQKLTNVQLFIKDDAVEKYGSFYSFEKRKYQQILLLVMLG